MGNTKEISHLLVLKCYSEIDKKEFITHKCCQILQLINASKEPFDEEEWTAYSVIVTKLISQCSDIEQLQSIHQQIDHHHADIFICSALINAYGTFGNVNGAENIFNGINVQHNTVSTNAMLKAYVNNSRCAKCLSLFDQSTL